MNSFKIILFLSFIIICSSCKKNANDPSPVPIIPPVAIDTSWAVYYNATELLKSTAFNNGVNLGNIQNKNLYEISGIAASYAIPKALWMEQDSGNPNVIYLFDKAGLQLGSAELTSISNRDWEDMSMAPGPLAGINYIYLAEIGDNKKVNTTNYIYRFPEPIISISVPNQKIAILDKITFHYPDGSKNAEAVMIDPLTKDVYVVSKEDNAVIYVAKYPQDVTKDFAMTKVGVLPISTVTAADISPDGSEVVIKTYSQIFYWKKTSNETISQLLKKTPILLPYTIEAKGEAICWATDGSGYYTTSEVVDNMPAFVSFYKRK